MKTTAQQLTKIITDAAEGTPYVIKLTEKGFELSLNIIDTKWIQPLNTGKISRYFKIDAVLDETTHKAILNETLFQLEWTAGVDGNLNPRIGAKLEVFQGETYSTQFGVVIGTPKANKQGIGITPYVFSSAEAKRWVNTLLTKNGWKKQRSLNTKIGIVAAVFGIIVSIIGIIIAIIATQ